MRISTIPKVKTKNTEPFFGNKKMKVFQTVVEEGTKTIEELQAMRKQDLNILIKENIFNAEGWLGKASEVIMKKCTKN